MCKLPFITVKMWIISRLQTQLRRLLPKHRESTTLRRWNLTISPILATGRDWKSRANNMHFSLSSGSTSESSTILISMLKSVDKQITRCTIFHFNKNEINIHMKHRHFKPDYTTTKAIICTKNKHGQAKSTVHYTINYLSNPSKTTARSTKANDKDSHTIMPGSIGTICL